MGKIPERQRRQLASEVVGTLGVDTTVTRTFEASARAVQSVAGVLQQKANKRAKASARRDSFVNRTNANKKMVDFNRGLNRIGSDAKDQDTYDQQTSDLLEEFSAGFESDEARAHFVSAAGNKMQRKGDSFFIRNEQRKVDTSVDNINGSIEVLAQEVEDTMGDSQMRFGDKMLLFAEQMIDSESIVNEAKGVIPDAAFNEFSDEKNVTLATAAVLALMDSNPDQVGAFLDQIEDTNVFSKEDVGTIMDQANQYKRKQTEIENRTQITANSNIESDLILRVTSGEQIPENEINQLVIKGPKNGGINATQAAALRKSNSLASSTFKGNNPVAYNALIEEHANIDLGFGEDFKDKLEIRGTFRGDRPSKAEVARQLEVDTFFAQISRYRQRVLESRNEKEITNAQSKSLLKMVNPVFREGVEGTIDELINKQAYVQQVGLWSNLLAPDEFVKGFESEDLPTESEKADMRMRFSHEMMTRIDEEENLRGRLSNKQVKRIFDDVRENFALRTDSDESKYRLGEIIPLDNGKKGQVVGYYLDGEADIEQDETKFKDFSKKNK